jgi:hypothetical protein
MRYGNATEGLCLAIAVHIAQWGTSYATNIVGRDTCLLLNMPHD